MLPHVYGFFSRMLRVSIHHSLSTPSQRNETKFAEKAVGIKLYFDVNGLEFPD